METKILDEDSLGKRDYMLAIGAGLAFMLVYFIFAARGMDPVLWSDLSASAGITPPRTIFPGIWRALTCGLLALFGKDGITFALRIVGSTFGGLSVFFSYLIIRETLAYLARARDMVAWRRIAPTFTLFATVSIGAGDAMIGGLLLGYQQENDMARAFRYGIAAGAASVMTAGTLPIVREDFYRLLDMVKIQEV